MKKPDGSIDSSGLSGEDRELLSSLLEDEGVNDGLGDVASILLKEAGGEIPVSSAQERLWLLEQLVPGTPTYHIGEALMFKGRLDVRALHRSLNEIVRRHGALRTAIGLTEGRPIQVIADTLHSSLPVVDLQELGGDVRKMEMLKLVRAEMQRTFDLTEAPLWRVILLSLTPDEHLFLLVIHHIISDGWSTEVFDRELAELYEAFSKDRPSPLPELVIQYSDYCVWEKQWLETEHVQSQYDYWKRQLLNLPVLDLPTDRPRPSVQSFRGALRMFELPIGLSNSLLNLSRQEGVTPFMTLLAGFAAVLHNSSGQEDISIGTPIANRSQPNTEEIIGFFVNTLVLRMDLTGNPSYRELLRRVRKVTLDAFDHQDVPFERLVAALQTTRDLSRSALRQVIFAQQNLLNKPIALSDVTISPFIEEVNIGVARLDVALYVWDGETTIQGALEYNTDLFEPATAERFIDHLGRVLEDMAADPDRLIITLPPLIEGVDLQRRPSATEQGFPAYGDSNLTQAQLLFWFSHKFQPEVRLYFDRVITTFTIDGRVDVGHFQNAFRNLVSNNDSLRSVIREADGVPRREVLDRLDFAPEYMDFSMLPNPQEALERWARDQFLTAMDFSVRLFDSALVKIAEDRFVWYLNVHHIITDMWSERLILAQMSEYYRTSIDGAPESVALESVALESVALESVALESVHVGPSYQAYVDWERGYRESQRYRKDEDYWKQKLAGDPSLCRFYAREGSSLSTQSVRVPHSLGSDRSRRIRKAVEEQGLLSPAVIFAAALFFYLYRTSGERTQRVGSSFANRTEVFKDTVGLFFNICPLQVTVTSRESWISLCNKTQVELIDTGRRQNYPVRNPVNDRVYNVNFTYQNVAFGDFAGMPARFDLVYSGHSIYNLGLQVHDFNTTGEFTLDFDFNCAAFDDQQRRRSVSHFVMLLDSFIDDSSQRLNHVAMLSSDEREQVLIELNQSAAQFPEDVCWAQLFEAQADRTPKQVAVVCKGERLTYSELNARANRLARILVEHGVGSDAVVALLAERGINFLTAVIAVLKAGGAYLPLDPRYPPNRLFQVVQQSGAGLVLVAERFTTIIDQAITDNPAARSLELLGIEDVLEKQIPEDNLPARCQPSNLAYVIYTSGSTGVPKGAMIEHRGMINHLFAKVSDLKLSESDVVAQTAPQAFDISVWQFLVALLVGGRVTIFTDEIAYDPTKLLTAVESEGVTVLETVPSLLRAMLEQIEQRGENRPELTMLRWMIPTGEALPPETCRQWFGHYPDIPMVNAYGPTECSDDVTHCFIVDPPHLDVAHMPIGRPVANTQLYVLDPDWQPVPMGIAGELYVGGAGVCRGYLNDPARTAEVFISNPFAEVRGERLYRTGDLARHLPDGSIEFLGRIDHQIKIRGFRIELGEIESALLRHSAVKEAVVVPFEHGRDDKRLAAYIVAHRLEQYDAASLRSFLRDKLPDYMLPNAYVAMDKLPLTPSGKIDRKSLPAPESKHLAAEESYVPPRSPVEKLIADIWKQVLGVERVGVHDDFFELGGQSLLATQLAYKIQQVLPVEISLRSFFEAPTVAKLAELVARSQNEGQDEDQQLLAEMLAEIEKLPESESLTQ